MNGMIALEKKKNRVGKKEKEKKNSGILVSVTGNSETENTIRVFLVGISPG